MKTKFKIKPDPQWNECMKDMDKRVKTFHALEPLQKELYNKLQHLIWDSCYKYFPHTSKWEELPPSAAGMAHVCFQCNTALSITQETIAMYNFIMEMRREKNKRKKEKMKKRILNKIIWLNEVKARKNAVARFGSKAWDYCNILYKKSIKIIDGCYPLLKHTHEFHRDLLHSHIFNKVMEETINTCAYYSHLMEMKLKLKKTITPKEIKQLLNSY